MSDNPNTGGSLGEEVEAPESVKVVQWVWHHMVGEGRMIRRAP